MKKKFSIFYSEKYHQAWTLYREIGVVTYIVRHGLLRFAVLLTIFSIIIGFVLGDIKGFSGLLSALPRLILQGIISGLIFGYGMWIFSEWNFKRVSDE